MDLLDLAGVLRQLVLDKHCLVAAANVNRRKLRFKCSSQPLIPNTDGMASRISTGMIFDDAVDKRQYVEIGLDDFIRRPVCSIEGKELTVRDVIRIGANVKGAIHYDPDPDDEYSTSNFAWDMLYIGGIYHGGQLLRDIARVLLNGLSGLISETETRPQYRPGPVDDDEFLSTGSVSMLVVSPAGSWVKVGKELLFHAIEGSGVHFTMRTSASGWMFFALRLGARRFWHAFRARPDWPAHLAICISWKLDGEVSISVMPSADQAEWKTLKQPYR